jgi:hypothetical protein
VHVKWSNKRRNFIAADPDFPRLRGYGKTEDAAIQDLEDKIEDYERECYEAGLELQFDDGFGWRSEE